jgi:hypothetical protein
MLNIVLISIALLVVGSIIIWNMAKSLRRPHRKAQFQSYWDAFNDPYICEEAYEYYEDGMHVHKKYEVPFSEISCEDELAFRTAAVHTLERTLAELYRTENKASPSFNDRVLKIRADMAKLMLIDMDENERKNVANTFVTS